MVYTWNESIQKWKTPYNLKKALRDGNFHQIEKGVYADTEQASTLEIIVSKYPTAIITMDTAFYYHGLTDVIPNKYHIATSESSRALRDPRIRQMFVKDEILNLGVIKMNRRGVTFQIYDRERMLIELLRFKKKLPFDFYKDIIGTYRNILYELDVERIQEYASTFPRHKMIVGMLEAEVF